MKEVVYVAESLKRYPLVYYPLITNLKANGIEVELLDTLNIWTRDYMPIQTKTGFVKFKYKTLKYEQYPQLRIDFDSPYWVPLFKRFNNLQYSNIVLDGGNCQMNLEKDVAIITDVVIKNNPEYKRDDLLEELSELLRAKIIIIPKEHGDELGHADGILKFISEDNIFLNEYTGKLMVKYNKKVKELLESNGFKVISFPNYWHLRPRMTEAEFRKKYVYADDFNPAWGYAINFLKVGRFVLVPIFNFKQDREIVDTVKNYYPNCSVVAIDCSELSMEGGLINCVTRDYMRCT
jgi:agmatine/peptidylarginine deiminase